MSHCVVKKSSLKGNIVIPASKSHTLRAILFGALATGKSVIYGYLPSPDTNAMIEACRLFGAKIEVLMSEIRIDGLDGKILMAEDVIHAGNSGIVLRFCSSIGGLCSHPIVVTGDASIRHHRPMKSLLEGLSQLGVTTSSMRGDGYAPVIIQGPMKAGKTTVCGADSQVVSALLIAAIFADGPIELDVKNAGEKSWVALTLNWLDRLGIPYEREGFDYFRVVGNAQYQGFEYQVPGDLSSAAFPIAAALITESELTLNNVDMQDVQGDKELFDVFRNMGADIEIDAARREILVKKGKSLQGVSVDVNNFIDGITILAVLACFAEGKTHIYNGAIAKQKECNRIGCIAAELRKMGADITETEDGLYIQKSSLIGSDVHSHEDHRMAMSLAVAAFGAKGETRISSFECAAKTFPNFVNAFKALGADIKVSS